MLLVASFFFNRLWYSLFRTLYRQGFTSYRAISLNTKSSDHSIFHAWLFAWVKPRHWQPTNHRLRLALVLVPLSGVDRACSIRASSRQFLVTAIVEQLSGTRNLCHKRHFPVPVVCYQLPLPETVSSDIGLTLSS
jgi:hypothetical protein